MINAKEINILKNINNLGIVDFDFLLISFHGKKSNSSYRRVAKFRLRVILKRLIDEELVKVSRSVLGENYYTLGERARIILERDGTKINPNALMPNSTLMVHHTRMMSVISVLFYTFNCAYRTEYMLRDRVDIKTVPDFIAVLFKKRFIFEIERSQKSDELISSKLSIYNIEFHNDFVIYLTESRSLAEKINKMKHAYANSSRIYAFEIFNFINDCKSNISFILSENEKEAVSNVH